MQIVSILTLSLGDRVVGNVRIRDSGLMKHWIRHDLPSNKRCITKKCQFKSSELLKFNAKDVPWVSFTLIAGLSPGVPKINPSESLSLLVWDTFCSILVTFTITLTWCIWFCCFICQITEDKIYNPSVWILTQVFLPSHIFPSKIF